MPTVNADLFKGIVVPIIAPCDENENLNHAVMMNHFNALMKTDIRGMYICGGTGDAEALTLPERKEIAELFVPQLKKAGKVSIVHVGKTNLRNAVELAKHAKKISADAIASVPPSASWDACEVFYRELAAVGIPVFIYYIPGMTGRTATLADISRLLDIPGVVGIKVSDWNVFLIRQIKIAYPDAIVYTGFDEMLIPGLSHGADGSIGTWANLFPKLYCKAFELTQAGEWARAHKMQEAFTAFLAQGWVYGILPAFEEIMSLKGAKCCFRKPVGWPAGKFPGGYVEKMLQQVEELEAKADSF